MSEYFKQREPRELTNRLIYVTIFVVVAFLLILIRIWSLQIMKGGHYTELSTHNRIRTVKSRAPRGLIHDRTGIKLADNRPGFDLYLVPEDVTDWDKTHAALKEALCARRRYDKEEDLRRPRGARPSRR